MFLWILTIISIVIIFLYFIFKFIDGNQDFWTKQGISYVHGNEIFNIWDRFTFRIPIHELDNQMYKYLKKEKDLKLGGTTLFRHPMLFILDLDLIKNILVKDFDYFINRRGLGFTDSKFDLMLFNMINQDWKDLRVTMTPTFTTSKLKSMFGIFIESGEKMVNFLQTELKKSSDSELELRGVCGRYTMDVIASAAFGVDSQTFENENSPFAVNGRKLQDNFSNTLLIKFILMILFPKIAKYLKMDFFNIEAINFFESVVKDSIRRRKELGEKRNDFLQLMLEAQDDTDTMAHSPEDEAIIDQYEEKTQLVDSKKLIKMNLSDELLTAQCISFFIGGFDNIETLLLWVCYELALNPDVQDKLYKELHGATNGDKENLTYDSVNNLVYLDMVVSETLRKYPPGVKMERKCNKDYKIANDNYVIKKDTHIIIPTYAIHHDPEIYPDPNKFDPERFNTENKMSRHPYAYLPFGLGPRSCIAMRFALMEGKAAVAHLVINFKFSPGVKTHIPMKYTTKGVLKPENGMWLKLEFRK